PVPGVQEFCGISAFISQTSEMVKQSQDRDLEVHKLLKEVSQDSLSKTLDDASKAEIKRLAELLNNDSLKMYESYKSETDKWIASSMKKY
ncbi:hypothetical protein O4G76_20625, partial [Limimaricola sp. G21655-S1]|uniref:hypothetical protein n=1 Tax=Limimaricola sp. G21655-S1 TaxID=3014768 RepID=UPI0022AFDA74